MFAAVFNPRHPIGLMGVFTSSLELVVEVGDLD